MAMSDPIADMLTRIRNAVRNKARTVTCLNSKVNRGIADVLQAEGYVEGYDVVEDGRQGLIKLRLRYGPRGETVIHEIRRESRPGRASTWASRPCRARSRDSASAWSPRAGAC